MPAEEPDVSKGYYGDYVSARCENERHAATAGYNRGNRGCSRLSLFSERRGGRRERLTIDVPARGEFCEMELEISGLANANS